MATRLVRAIDLAYSSDDFATRFERDTDGDLRISSLMEDDVQVYYVSPEDVEDLIEWLRGAFS